MSYDLVVYAPIGLSPSDLHALVAGTAPLDVGTGSLPDFTTVVRGARRRPSFSIEGPERLDPEDVPEEVAGVVLDARVLYTLLVAGSDPGEIPHAVRFARRLAQQLDGAVVDCQTDEIWSRSRSRRVVRPQPRSRVAAVDVTWHCRLEDVPEDPVGLYLDRAARDLPEALPRRFGETEPLQGRYDEVGASGLREAWRRSGSEGVSLQATQPAVGGFLDGPGETGDRWWSLGISLLADPLREEGWRRSLRRLFVGLAEDLGAFHAQADVSEGWIWSGRSLYADRETGSGMDTLYGTAGWLGLPPAPMWWTWLGAPYRHLADLLPSELVSRTGTGAMVESAPAPVPTSELLPLGRWLPPEVFAVALPTPSNVIPQRLGRAAELPAELDS